MPRGKVGKDPYILVPPEPGLEFRVEGRETDNQSILALR